MRAIRERLARSDRTELVLWSVFLALQLGGPAARAILGP
jgi:hypothetical protein